MKKFVKRVVWCVGGLCLLGLAVYLILNLVFSAQLRGTLAELKAKERPMTVAEIAPPPVPDDQNAALLISQAVNLVRPGQTNSLSPLLGILSSNVTAQRTPLTLATWSDDQRAEALRAMHAPEMVSLFSLIEQASQRPGYDNRLDYTAGAAMILPNLGPYRNLVRLLAIKVVVEAQEGHPAQALQTIAVALRTNNKLRQEPVLISQLVRLACDQILLETLIMVASTPDLPSESCSPLIQELSVRQNETEVWTRTLDAERVFLGMWAFDLILNNPSQISTLEDFADQPVMMKHLPAWAWRPFLKKDFAVYLQLFEKMRRYFQEPFYVAAAAEIRDQALDKQIPSYALLTRGLFPNLVSVTAKMAEHQARVAVCRVGLALKLYGQRNGRYPETLGALVPEFLDAVPAAPCTGAPLVYRLANNGFILYSVGTDQKDDQGAPRSSAPASLTNYDIVWTCGR
jgi:hypothetical protein